MKWTTYLKIFVFLLALGSMLSLVYGQEIGDIQNKPIVDGDRYTYKKVDSGKSIKKYTNVKPRVVRGGIQKIEYYRNNRKVDPETEPARGDITVEVTPKIDVGNYQTLANGVQRGNFGYSIEINPWLNQTFQYRIPVTISNTDVPTDLNNFPVYTDVSNLPSQFHDNVQSDMCDVRVTKADGSTQLPAERVSYDAGTDTGELHHKQNLSSSSDTTYYIYWGTNITTSCPSFTANNGRDNVWTFYDRVYHLNEASGSTATNSVGGNSGTYDDDLPDARSSVLGDGQDLDGSGDRVQTPDDSDIDYTGNVSVSIWGKTDVTPSANSATLFTKGEDASSANNHDYEAGITSAREVFWKVSDSSDVDTVTGSALNTGQDYLMHFVRNSLTNNQFIYLNGAQDASGISTKTITTDFQFFIGLGTKGTDTREWDGVLREVRVTGNVISSGWSTTEYNMQNDNANFLNIGTTETFNTPPTQFNLTTPNGDTFNGKTNVTFNWESANDADNDTLSYTVNVYNQSNGNFVTNATTNNNVTTVDIELTPSNYSWNATVTDVEATSTSVQTYNFTITDVPNSPPTQFNLTSPNGETFNGEQDIILNWETSTDANNDTLTYTANVYDQSSGVLLNTATTTQTATTIPNVTVGNYTWNATVTDGQDTNTSVQTYNFSVQQLVSACTNYAQCIDGRQECLQTNDGTNPDTFDRTCTSTNLGSGFLAIMLGVSFILMFFGWRMRHYQLGVLGSFIGILTSLGIVYVSFLYTFVLIAVFITTGYLFTTNRLQS